MASWWVLCFAALIAEPDAARLGCGDTSSAVAQIRISIQCGVLQPDPVYCTLVSTHAEFLHHVIPPFRFRYRDLLRPSLCGCHARGAFGSAFGLDPGDRPTPHQGRCPHPAQHGCHRELRQFFRDQRAGFVLPDLGRLREQCPRWHPHRSELRDARPERIQHQRGGQRTVPRRARVRRARGVDGHRRGVRAAFGHRAERLIRQPLRGCHQPRRCDRRGRRGRAHRRRAGCGARR